MAPSSLFFDLVKAFEGLRLTAYQDEHLVWTVGYGTTKYSNGVAVAEGDTCTREEAMSYMTDHVSGEQLPANLSQQQYDACLDFTYNEGQSAWNTSTLRKNVISGAGADTITANFCVWDKMHVDGQLVERDGLLRRRKCEAYLYINGVNEPTFYLG